MRDRYLLGQDSDYPPVNFDAWNLNAAVNTHVNVQADHATYVRILFSYHYLEPETVHRLIREIGGASTVLLKNVGGALPLNKPRTIGIVGNGAGPSSKGANGYTDRGGDDGVLAMGWGSGYVVNVSKLRQISRSHEFILERITSRTS